MRFNMSRRALMLNAAALSSLSACAGAPEATPNDALGDDDAIGVATRIRAREISASEALEAAIARVERVNRQLNFIATPAYDLARQRAATNPIGPFAGVPTLIKDLEAVGGVGQHYGSRAFGNNVARENSPYVDTLLRAGLVPFGKTTTPEFGLTATTEPLLGGPTRNPWDTTRSSGGSSGGAAVAVASRAVPIAHASDGGGSIRIPASCNGLVGLKYTRGRAMSRTDDDFLSVNGCVSRSVRDTAGWLSITERQQGELAPIGLVQGPSTRRLRIGLAIADTRGVEPDAEIRSAIEGVAELCRGLGHDVREKALGIDGQAFADSFTLVWAAGAADITRNVRANAPANVPLDALLEPLTLQLAQRFIDAGPGALERAMVVLRGVEAHYATLFSDTDVLLTPVLAKVPPPLGEIAPTLGLAGFEKVAAYVAYTPLQNVAGAPALSLPLAWSAGGLPIGAHFSAAKGQEKTLLELAFELEQARPWAARKPAVNAG